jgi:hypothetical protein
MHVLDSCPRLCPRLVRSEIKIPCAHRMVWPETEGVSGRRVDLPHPWWGPLRPPARPGMVWLSASALLSSAPNC